MAGAGRADLRDNVTFAILVRTSGDRMFGVTAGPEAETVVVLGGQYQLLQSPGFASGDDLVSAEVRRVEDRGILIAGSPFAVGEGVDREVQESVGFKLMPRALSR